VKKNSEILYQINFLFRLIHAFDIDEQRVKSMTDYLKQHHIRNVRLKCLDFLLTDPEKYDRVNYIQLDPSCSGSGMTNRFKFGDTEQESVKDEKRLWNLEALQRRMIKHAMSFKNVKRIVYSTCSIYEEENENVVRYALKHSNGRFKLVNIFENKWKYGRGICKSDADSNELHLDYCIRTSFENNFTNGFFISLFESVEDEEV
jgi:putative methyltransferase